MGVHRLRAPGLTALLGVTVLASTGWAQSPPTLFTTEDYRQDEEYWADPAYYRNNTARQITDMQVDVRYGEEGNGRGPSDIKSPYPFTSSWEHYETWLHEANGGTQHTIETLPNWDGLWDPGGSWLAGAIQASTVAAALTPEYRQYYVQQLKAESEGRHWWPASFCLPEGLIRAWPMETLAVRTNQIVMVTDVSRADIAVRWIDTSGRGHSPEAWNYPQWHGESIGFWDGDALVVHTNQLKGWNSGHSMFEYSDQMTTVERYQRVGDTIEAELTMYDPVALLYPVHAKSTLELNTDPEARPVFSTCTDTQGPARNIYVDADGVLQERDVTDPDRWDATISQPWRAHYEIGE